MKFRNHDLNPDQIRQLLEKEQGVSGDPDYLRFISGVLSEEVQKLFPEPQSEQQCERQILIWKEQLLSDIPLQYVLGKAWFLDLELAVNPSVLIPRPETEELVELISSREKGNLKILDIGTGSGCIAIGLKKLLPEAVVTGTDISHEALQVARYNSDACKTAADFIQHDISAGAEGLPDQLDILVSNPPYIAAGEKQDLDANVINHEPALALFAPEGDPLFFYRKIRDAGLLKLKSEGRIYLEINQLLGEQTMELFNCDGFRNTVLIRDMSGNNRFIITIRC